LPKRLDGGGQATLTTSSLTAGSHTITASFTSDSANFNNSSGNATQTVTEARTTLTDTGATSSVYHDSVVLSARLTRTDNSAPITLKTVTLTMGLESCTATTGANGDAACSITPSDLPGLFPVNAAFADDGNYLASSDSQPFTITKEDTTLTYSGPTVFLAGASGATLSAQLLQDDQNDTDGDGASTPPAPFGQMITFTLDGQTCHDATDATGVASCTIPAISGSTLGSKTIATSFAGGNY
jgi:Bacterial Ig-like domain (group 3)